MSRPVASLLFGIVFHPTIARRERKTANWRWRILFGHLKSQRSSKRQAKEKITFLIRLSSLPLIMTDSSRNRLWLNQKSCAEMPSHASADWLWCARRLIKLLPRKILFFPFLKCRDARCGFWGSFEMHHRSHVSHPCRKLICGVKNWFQHKIN